MTAVALLGPKVRYTELHSRSPIMAATMPLNMPYEMGSPATSAYAMFTGKDSTATLKPARKSEASLPRVYPFSCPAIGKGLMEDQLPPVVLNRGFNCFFFLVAL